MHRWTRLLAMARRLAIILALPLLAQAAPPPPAAGPLAFAVLGDSGSHAYQDDISFPPGTAMRGGPLRRHTFQWTEVLARLRPESIDPGAWGTWGQRRELLWLRRVAGLTWRGPRKQDYRYNFARSGAECDALLDARYPQVPQLLTVMDEDPARWRGGVIVIAIGVNSYGSKADLDALSRDPDDPVVQGKISGCVRAIAESVRMLRQRHPDTRIVVFGADNGAHWPPNFDRWRSAKAIRNIDLALDRFDDGLRALERRDPMVAMFESRRWLVERWGSRDDRGEPAYRPVRIGTQLLVTNSLGDGPEHAYVADGHAGLVLNALWAQSIVEFLDTRFNAGIPRVGDDEVARLVAEAQRAVRGPAAN